MMAFHMGYGFIGWFLMTLFWIILIILGVWLAKSLFGNRGNSNQQIGTHSPSAKEILDQRYARGEITREQYDLMKKDLNSDQS